MSYLQEPRTADPFESWNEYPYIDSSSVQNSDVMRFGEILRKNCCQQPLPNKVASPYLNHETPHMLRQQESSAELPFEADEWTLSNASIKFNQSNNGNNHLNNNSDHNLRGSLPRINSQNISASILNLRLQKDRTMVKRSTERKVTDWGKMISELSVEERQKVVEAERHAIVKNAKYETMVTNQPEKKAIKINSMRQALSLVVIVAGFLNSIKNFASEYKFKRMREREFDMIADKASYYPYFFENEYFISNLPSSVRRCWTSFKTRVNELPLCGEFIRATVSRIRWKDLLILPNSMLKIIWDCFMFSLLSFNIFYVPIKITWEDNDTGGLILNEWVQIFLNDLPGWTFLLDILLAFNTAIYNKGNVIFNRRKIVKNYLKTKFFGDLLIVIPFIVNFQIKMPLLNLILLLRTNKMFKLALYFEQLFNLKPQQAALYNLFKLIFMIIFVAHFCGCMFFLVANIQKSYDPQVQTWVDIAKIADEEWFNQYITSLYWAVITMVTIGYGDITPITPSERAFVILITLISCGVFAYSINQIGHLISALTQDSNELKLKMGLLTRHLRNRGVSHDLQMQVRKYFEYWHQGKGDNDGEQCDQMIESLSNTLRSEVLNDIRYRVINQMPILKSNFSTGFLKSIATHLRTKRTKPEEVLIEEQQVNDKLYFLVQGIVCSFISIKRDNFISYTQMKQFKQGSIFDQISFMADLRSLTGYRSIGSCTLYYVCKEDFLKTLANFPLDFEKYQLIKDNISIYRSQRNIGTKCHFCEKYTHSFDRCPYIKYIPYSEKQLTIYRASIEQIRMPHERRPQRIRVLAEYNETKERAVNYLIENNPFANEEELIERLEMINVGEDEFLAAINDQYANDQSIDNINEIEQQQHIQHIESHLLNNYNTFHNHKDDNINNARPSSILFHPEIAATTMMTAAASNGSPQNRGINQHFSNYISAQAATEFNNIETLNHINTIKNSSNLNNPMFSNAEFNQQSTYYPPVGQTPKASSQTAGSMMLHRNHEGSSLANQYEAMLSGNGAGNNSTVNQGGGPVYNSFSDANNYYSTYMNSPNPMNGSGGQQQSVSTQANNVLKRKNVKQPVRSNQRKKTRTEDLAIIKLRQAKLDSISSGNSLGSGGGGSGAYIQPYKPFSINAMSTNLKKIDEAHTNSASGGGLTLNNSIDYSEQSQKSSHKNLSKKKSKVASQIENLMEAVEASVAVGASTGQIPVNARSTNLRKYTHENSARQNGYFYSSPAGTAGQSTQSYQPQTLQHLTTNLQIIDNAGQSELVNLQSQHVRRSSIHLTQTNIMSLAQQQQQQQQQIQLQQQLNLQNMNLLASGNLSGHQQLALNPVSAGAIAIPYHSAVTLLSIPNRETFMQLMEFEHMKLFTVYYPSGNYSNVIERVQAMIVKFSNPKNRKKEETNKLKKSVNKILHIRQLQNSILKKNVSSSARPSIVGGVLPVKKVISQQQSSEINVS